jgi:hypothetical protein
MAYIGNTAEQQAFTPRVDYFSGNASATAFTLSFPVASVAQVQAVIENVPQNPGDAYTVSGNTITFTSAPPSGTNNIYVYYTSPITQVIQPGQGTVGLTQLTATGNASSSTFLRGDNSWQVVSVTPTAVSDQLNASTGYFDLPVGTTAQRPGSPASGMTRFNSTLGYPEWYETSTSQWVPFSYNTYDAVDYLIVAGGGGGASGFGGIGGGGGGAGGCVSGTTTFIPGTSYTVTVGAGGAGATSASSGSVGVAGSNSLFGALTTAVGGGFARSWISGDVSSSSGSGGSGGGGGWYSITAGSGTAGQGFAGGSGAAGSPNSGGGGGGGATAVGANGTTAAGGNGGSGLNWQSLGTFYAGGGGGGASLNSPGTGGSSVGGNGGFNGSNGTAGTVNRGGGGGGGGSNGALGGAGSSGIVVIRYPGPQRATGGTVTSSGGYTIHTFTTSGTLTA